MGYNTVAFILNDMSNDITKSPRSAAWPLAHPPMSDSDEARFHNYRRSIAADFDEPVLPSQSLCVLPTFHASERRFFFAGGNCMEMLQVQKFGKTKDGKKTVTLVLPDWWK